MTVFFTFFLNPSKHFIDNQLFFLKSQYISSFTQIQSHILQTQNVSTFIIYNPYKNQFYVKTTISTNSRFWKLLHTPTSSTKSSIAKIYQHILTTKISITTHTTLCPTTTTSFFQTRLSILLNHDGLTMTKITYI